MDTGATLAELIEGVQLEVGHSTNPAVGVNFRDTIAAAIRREYRRLHADFNWPHLLDWHTAAVAAGEHYPDLPDGVDLSRIVQLWHRLPGGDWRELRRDLGVADYNEVDSDANERRDPARKWRSRGEGVEIWPMPMSAGQLRYVAKSAPVALQAETDPCDIDTDVLILFAAASVLFKGNSDRAGLILQRGRNSYQTLKQRLQTGGEKVNLRG